MCDDCIAMCCDPAPWLNSRYSSIWLLRLPSAGSWIGLVVGAPGVGNTQRDVLHAVTVGVGVSRDLVLRMHGARDHEPDVVLLEDVARAVADARLGPGIRSAPEPERALVVIRGLL